MSPDRERRWAVRSWWLLASALVLAALSCSERIEVLTGIGTGGTASDGGLPVGCAACQIGDICIASRCRQPQLGTLTAGEAHTCRIVGGILSCWGSNEQGQLGTGDTTRRLTPTRVRTMTMWQLITAGANHTCGIVRASQTVMCWGDNRQGQLGDSGDNGGNNMMGGGGRPRGQPLVSDLTEVFDLDCGGDNCCLLRASGALWCWGANASGAVGVASDGAPVPRPTRVAQESSFLSVSVGRGHACAVRNDGALMCWGENDAGQLGDDTLTSRVTPRQVGSDVGWARVSAGDQHTCGLRSNGLLLCWGANYELQLGSDPNMPDSADPMTESPAPVDIDDDWWVIATGDYHSCGLKGDDVLQCWGRNTSNQLGSPDERRHVATTITWQRIALGAAHSCGTDLGQQLYCWGANEQGQLGLGDTLQRARPTLVPY
ncbi:MAG: hypothetical protein ABW321_08985 [Polyangiales bacterium]